MYFKCRKPNIFLYFSAISVNLASFTIGCCFAWTSPAISRLNGLIEPDYNPLGSEGTITVIEESLLASLLLLGAAVSSLISGHLARTKGRKEVLVVSTITVMIGLGIMHFAKSVQFLYLSRLFCGLGAGAIFTVVPIYISEIAEDSNRGILRMFTTLFFMLGVLFTYGVGSVVSLSVLNLTQFAAPLLFMIIFDWFIPESPYWLMSQNRPQDAEKSLRKLRISSEDKITTELMEIRKHVEEASRNMGSLKELLSKKEIIKGIYITCGLVLFQQLSGVNVMIFYMQEIFTKTENNLPADLSSVIVATIQVIACIISSYLIDSIGRRILLLFSSLGTCLSLTSFGVYFYLKDMGGNVNDINWLPIVSVACFMAIYAIGLGPIPFLVLGEIFPQQIKTTATTITIFVCLILAFCSTTLFPPLVNMFGMAYISWTLAVFSFIGSLFILMSLPETRGRNLQEIQEILRK